MYSLSFDTTASYCSVALYKENALQARFEKQMEFGHAESLLTEIQNILEKENLQFTDLSLVNVCTGPGSFTGVRSSLAAARTFALACPKLQVCGVSAFEAYADSLEPSEQAEINAVLIETKREDYYVQYYDQNMEKLEPPSTAFEDNILEKLRGKKVSLAGDALERFLNKPRGLSLHALKFFDHVPLENLAHCGLKKYHQKKTDYPKPLYLKAPDVCIK